MVIVYDFEITNTKVTFTDIGDEIIYTIREYIRQRLNVLQDKIDAQGGAILINILNTVNDFNPDIPLGISYGGFTEDLEEKMKSCFNDNDWRLIMLKLLEIKGKKDKKS